jgi:hypothetical protein
VLVARYKALRGGYGLSYLAVYIFAFTDACHALVGLGERRARLAVVAGGVDH